MDKINKRLNSFYYSLFALLIMGCSSDMGESNLTENTLIPQPDSVIMMGRHYKIGKKLNLFLSNENEALANLGQHLSEIIEANAACETTIQTHFKKIRKTGIYLKIIEQGTTLGIEGYQLDIRPKHIVISAAEPAGLFYGVQSLHQLIIENSGTFENSDLIAIPTGTILDTPRFEYRGIMLDVARHFFSVEEVKQVIEYLAYYKLNKLHLHLTDDQGWRIEIKSWPNLTDYGSKTQVGGGTGGYYSQEQFTEIVNFAKSKYIEVVPEIDMPGHTNAALASYSQLNCDGKARKLYTGTRVGFSSLCVNKNITYEFVEDVIREISLISPGKYIHIGGDESDATSAEDYQIFMNRVQKIVSKYDKTLIGWDEVAQTKIDSGTVVQFWNHENYALQGIDKGARIIMSPAEFTYLDMKYDSSTVLGLDWAGHIDVEKAYKWYAGDLLKGNLVEYVLGIEAPLWSETVANLDEIEYMLFPRLPGYAEIGWSRNYTGNWKEYKNRLAGHAKWFNQMNINYHKSALVPWSN
jgi:hexosaminidase